MPRLFLDGPFNRNDLGHGFELAPSHALIRRCQAFWQGRNQWSEKILAWNAQPLAGRN